MGTERQVEYYDAVYSVDSNYHSDYSESNYLPLYSAVSDYLKTTLNHKIFEIGCGTGQLAKYLYDLGYAEYIGMDFSPVAIGKAKEMSRQHFFVGDALHYPNYNLDYNIAIAIEILEHIQEDKRVIHNIRPGCEVILSFPTFDDPAHVRYFKRQQDILNRYEDLVQFNHVLPVGPWFLVRGVIR